MTGSGDAAARRRTAALLGAARLNSAPVPDIPGEDVPAAIAEGYAVQAVLHDYLGAHGHGTPAGWKVGATTSGMQAYLGVDGPAYGRIFDADILESGAAVAAAGFCNPGIECELAVRIATDAADRNYDETAVSDLVDCVLPAIEIVENRYGDFLARGTPTLIADDFFHKAVVVGTPVTDWQALDLAGLAARTLIDGEERGTGTGDAVLGHPMRAVAWLANALRENGERLRGGEIVMTGSMPPVIWLETFPCRAEVEIGGLGGVTLELT